MILVFEPVVDLELKVGKNFNRDNFFPVDKNTF